MSEREHFAPSPTSPLQRLHAADPLWMRAPSQTENGEPVADFMMLIPALKRAQPAEQRDCLARLQTVLNELGEDVLFADFNRNINVLWISHRCRQGVTRELCTAIRERVPEAKLIANQVEMDLGDRRTAWKTRFKQSWLAAHGRRLLGRS